MVADNAAGGPGLAVQPMNAFGADVVGWVVLEGDHAGRRVVACAAEARNPLGGGA